MDERLRPQRGQMRRLDDKADSFKIVPNKVTTIFSNQDMFDVLKLLTEKNIVLIFGIPGVGKSTLLKNITYFVAERNFYKNGVIYIDFSNVSSFKEAVTEIVRTVKMVYVDGNYQSFNNDEMKQEL